MKALTSIKFPQLSSLKRTTTEKQHDDINQARLNQNFKAIADAIHELETREPVVQGGGGGISVLQAFYPVGAVYISTVSTDPATLFGFGTWERIQDRFLLAAGSSYAAGSTGGEATHILTVNETPSHSHTRGTMDITGKFRAFSDYNKATDTSSIITGAFTVDSISGSSGNMSSGESDANRTISFKASNTWTGSTSSVGGSAAHNNMPPYLAVFMWKRTA